MLFWVALLKKKKIVYSLKNLNIPKTSLLEFTRGMPFRAGIRPLISPVLLNVVSQRGQANSQFLPVTLLVQLAKVVVEDLNNH